MLDDDLKRLLKEMKLDDVIDEFENGPIPKQGLAEPSEPVATAHDLKTLHDEINALADELHEQKAAIVAPSSHEPHVPNHHLPLNTMLVGITAVLFAVVCFLYFKPQAPAVPVQSTQLIAQNDVDEEAEEVNESHIKALSWAKKITALDSDTGHSVQLLWNMLERRQRNLSDIADELSDALYNNAERQSDYSMQEASTLLARYQAMNARFSFEIANQIYLIDSLVQKMAKPMLQQYFHEFLGELGCETYSSHQIQIVKQIVKQEEAYKECLTKIEKSSTLSQLAVHLKEAKSSFAVLENNGFAQTFSQLSVLKQEIAPSVQIALTHIFENKDAAFGPDSEVLLDEILSESELPLSQRHEWQQEQIKPHQESDSAASSLQQ